jgi:hypothetical protein
MCVYTEKVNVYGFPRDMQLENSDIMAMSTWLACIPLLRYVPHGFGSARAWVPVYTRYTPTWGTGRAKGSPTQHLPCMPDAAFFIINADPDSELYRSICLVVVGSTDQFGDIPLSDHYLEIAIARPVFGNVSALQRYLFHWKTHFVRENGYEKPNPSEFLEVNLRIARDVTSGQHWGSFQSETMLEPSFYYFYKSLDNAALSLFFEKCELQLTKPESRHIEIYTLDTERLEHRASNKRKLNRARKMDAPVPQDEDSEPASKRAKHDLIARHVNAQDQEPVLLPSLWEREERSQQDKAVLTNDVIMSPADLPNVNMGFYWFQDDTSNHSCDTESSSTATEVMDSQQQQWPSHEITF